MEITRKFIITALVGAAFAGMSPLEASAQEDLKLKAEAMAHKVDSLQTRLQALRNQYSQSSAEERQMIASEIMTLEPQAVAAGSEFEQLRLSLAQQGIIVEVQQKRTDTPSEQNTMRTLEANPFFRSNLSRDDYSQLLSVAKLEKNISRDILDVRRMHESLVALSDQYRTCQTEAEANQIKENFEKQISEMQLKSSDIGDEWQKVMDNKTYIYNLLMEKFSRQDILTQMESTLVQAEGNVSQVSRNTSPALAAYAYQKPALLRYETEIARMRNMTQALDSLETVSRKFRPQSYLLEVPHLEQRVFIEVEPIEYKGTSYYNYKNPIPAPRIYQSGTVYRIRVGVYSQLPGIMVFKGLAPLSKTKEYHDGKTAYFLGSFDTYDAAIQARETLKSKGFRNPVICMWRDGAYIPNAEEFLAAGGNVTMEIRGVESLQQKVRDCIMRFAPGAQISKSAQAFILSGVGLKDKCEQLRLELVLLDSAMQISINENK